MRFLERVPEQAKDPTPEQIKRVAHTLRSKVEDMDRAGDVVATFAPVTLGPEEIRAVSFVLEGYLREPE